MAQQGISTARLPSSGLNTALRTFLTQKQEDSASHPPLVENYYCTNKPPSYFMIMDKIVTKKKSIPRSQAKDVSVMAWIEDSHGHILMVRQTAGKKLWALPGGKVRRNESLFSALCREVLEETGLVITQASPMDFFDRHQKGNLTILFHVLIKKKLPVVHKKRVLEISDTDYKASLPSSATPSAKYFWKRIQNNFKPFTLTHTG